MSSKLLAIAAHELAHACLAIVFRAEVVSVELYPDHVRAAGVTTMRGLEDLFESSKIKIFLAGALAERRMPGGEQWAEVCSSDCADVADTMARGLDLGELVIAADKLVTKYWARIERAAAVLTQRRRMTGEEVRAALGL
jgi:hypothetical protein